MDCPNCGRPSDELDVLYNRLSDLGYMHEDTRYECDCGHTFQKGEPKGHTESKTWICDSCGGDLIPHFLFARGGQISTRPKCQECYLVLDEKIQIDSKVQGETIRGLVGHHTVTGENQNMEF